MESIPSYKEKNSQKKQDAASISEIGVEALLRPYCRGPLMPRIDDRFVGEAEKPLPYGL